MAEEVIFVNGKYEVDPARMTEVVRQQRMNEAERDRIIASRHQFLDWMHLHFAKRVMPPPEDADVAADG
jgi:hypothetical protein